MKALAFRVPEHKSNTNVLCLKCFNPKAFVFFNFDKAFRLKSLKTQYYYHPLNGPLQFILFFRWKRAC